MLHLMAARLPLQARYDRDELARLLQFSQALAAAVDHDAHAQVITTLRVANSAGGEALASATVEAAEILQAIHNLRTHTGALISTVYRDGKDVERARITTLTLAHADAQLLRERAWLAPMGWETEPLAMPAIVDLLK